jgi:hypothetical protein
VDQYVLALTNIGGAGSGVPVTLTDTLPEGVTVHGSFVGSGWACGVTSVGGLSVVTCTYGNAVPSLETSAVLTIPIAVAGADKGKTVTSAVEVSGGGAPLATAEVSSLVSAQPPPFGFLDFNSQTIDVSGAPDAQAGDRPYALTTAFDFPQREVFEPPPSPEEAVGLPRAMVVELPPGLTGSALSVAPCKITEVVGGTCPASRRVGTLFLNLAQGLFAEDTAIPVYNVVPERGYPVEFGLFIPGREKPSFLYVSVRRLRSGSGYGLVVTIPDLPAVARATNVVATFFGDPGEIDGGGKSPTALVTNPSDCSGGPLVTYTEVDTWAEPNTWTHGEAPFAPVAGCYLLQFQPSILIVPESMVADEPTGYTADVQVPQARSGVEGPATPDVRDATVTLPQGVGIDPAVADGIATCPGEGVEGINITGPLSEEAGPNGPYEQRSAPGHCPLASQLGTAEASTPALAEPLHGHVYAATPGCGGTGQPPCTEADAQNGNLYAVYLQLEGSGVVIKARGSISANPASGQLTASFRETPQQPFSDLRVLLKGGPRAPLSNPQTCGEALTTSDMTPWSSPQTPDATPSWAFQVTGCEGSPFAPAFEAGTTNPAAGAYTNVTATIARSDRMQDLSAIQVQTPPGLLAMISHVPLCEEPQAAQGGCSPVSRIGTATASAGAGSHPFWVSGPVYLTGPYRGAPFGLSIPVQAKAGPFNLGTIVTRAMLNVDPITAAATVTSDPLPQIFDGIPLRVQTVNVTLNRSQFVFNPTNCEAQQITATIASAQGAVAHVSSPFAAGGCKNLPFNPGFKVATRAPGSKKKGTSLDVKVSSSPGQANIHSVFVSLPKQLPARLTTLQQACPEATFAANPATCPAGSLVGFATGTTPVLPVPIAGPAYLVSHGGAAFPNLEVILQGEGVRVDLSGATSIAHGITSSRFANVPDAPISSFELKLPEGPHSALTTNGSLCAKPLVMPTTIVGQNGRRLVRSTKISVSGCPKKKPKPKKKRGK